MDAKGRADLTPAHELAQEVDDILLEVALAHLRELQSGACKKPEPSLIRVAQAFAKSARAPRARDPKDRDGLDRDLPFDGLDDEAPGYD